MSARICHNFLPYSSVVNLGMVQVVSRRPFKIVTCVLSQASPCVICGGNSETGTGLSPSPIVFPCQNLSTNASYPLIYLSQTLYNRKNWQRLLSERFRQIFIATYVYPRSHSKLSIRLQAVYPTTLIPSIWIAFSISFKCSWNCT